MKNEQQYSLEDFTLKEVKVRLKLEEGERLFSGEALSSPRAIAECMQEYLKENDREYFLILNMDAKMHPINFNVVSIGCLNASLAHPREVFKSAILSNAAGVVMVHNHPSGDPEPSAQDLDLTRKLIMAGDLLDMPVFDHLIIGDSWRSVREEMPHLWEQARLDLKNPDALDMLRETPAAPVSKRDEYRRAMADMFIQSLKEQGLSWKKGWKSMGKLRNGITNRPYRGSNVFTLLMVSQLKGLKDPRWYSFNQIADRNGKYHPGEKWKLKKGSKASYVEYWFCYDKKAAEGEKRYLSFEEADRLVKDGRREETDFVLKTRYFAVYNGDMVEGLPPYREEVREAFPTDEAVEKISRGMGVSIQESPGGEAYYRPAVDTVFMPAKESFFSEGDYHATALHELTHASGHASRLGRELSGGFGSESYAREELVAEIGSAFLGYHLGCETESLRDNHKAYVQSWIQHIQEKPEALEQAIKDALKAADYMEKAGGLLPGESAASDESRFPEEGEAQAETADLGVHA